MKIKKIAALIASTLLGVACIFGGFDRSIITKAEEDSPLYQTPEILTDPDEMQEVIDKAGRSWQGAAPGIAVTKGGRLFACLFSGGEKEPQAENYAIYMYSDDNGKTWVDPFLIINHPSHTARITDPSLQVDSLGRLWIFWNQQYPMTGSSAYGWWSIRIDNPDAPIEDVISSINNAVPVRHSDGIRINKFIERKNGEWIQPIAITGAQYIYIYASGDQGDTWELRGSVYGGGGRTVYRRKRRWDTLVIGALWLWVGDGYQWRSRTIFFNDRWKILE